MAESGDGLSLDHLLDWLSVISDPECGGHMMKVQDALFVAFDR
jgi:hypothetical protein